MTRLIWLYSVNSLTQTFIFENEQNRKQMTIDEAVLYLINLIDYYNPDAIAIKSVDFHSQEYENELKFKIENKMENLIPIEVIK